MKKTLLTIAMFSACVMFSCKKESDGVTTVTTVSSTSNIQAPSGFTWESSRNLNFTINVTDSRFPKIASVISIYDADPNNGGNLLTKGSATTLVSFKTKLYLSDQITKVFIVKTSPDNTNLIQAVQVGTADVIVAIGI
jgi:hypothetical protein